MYANYEEKKQRVKKSKILRRLKETCVCSLLAHLIRFCKFLIRLKKCES